MSWHGCHGHTREFRRAAAFAIPISPRTRAGIRRAGGAQSRHMRYDDTLGCAFLLSYHAEMMPFSFRAEAFFAYDD